MPGCPGLLYSLASMAFILPVVREIAEPGTRIGFVLMLLLAEQDTDNSFGAH